MGPGAGPLAAGRETRRRQAGPALAALRACCSTAAGTKSCGKRYQEDAGRLAKEAASADDAYFLAEYIVGQSARVLQANEMLALLDVLQAALRKATGTRAGPQALAASGVSLPGPDRADRRSAAAAKATRGRLSARLPLQQQYAQALASAGDYPAAYAWLTRVLVKEAKWLEYEEESLRNIFTGFLEQQGRYAELVNYLAEWVEQNPAGRSAYEQYLSALIKSDQIEKADALVTQLAQGSRRCRANCRRRSQARLHAAVYLMLGNGLRPLHQPRRGTLAGAAGQGRPVLRPARDARRHRRAASCRSTSSSSSDEARKLRKTLAGILTAEIDKLPAEQVRRFVNWVHSDDAEPADWEKIADGLRQRWTNEAKDRREAHARPGARSACCRAMSAPNEVLAFLRLQLQTGPREASCRVRQPALRPPARPALVGGIRGRSVCPARQTLRWPRSAGERLFTAVAALHRLTDTLLEGRYRRPHEDASSIQKSSRGSNCGRNRKRIGSWRAKASPTGCARKRPSTRKALARWLVAESTLSRRAAGPQPQAGGGRRVGSSWRRPPARPKADEEPSDRARPRRDACGSVISSRSRTWQPARGRSRR